MPASTVRAVVSPWPAHGPEGFVQAVFRAQKESSLPHFGACLGGGVVLINANSADAIAVGDPVRRRGDDAIIKRNARRQLNVAAEITGDRHRLEQHLVV